MKFFILLDYQENKGRRKVRILLCAAYDEGVERVDQFNSR